MLMHLKACSPNPLCKEYKFFLAWESWRSIFAENSMEEIGLERNMLNFKENLQQG